MPLVVICGYPCSGKTRRAAELQAHFENAAPKLGLRSVLVVSDHSLGICRDAYNSIPDEKRARASLLAATERALARDALVILDSGNFIKGYRYQLHCLVRSVGTTLSVIQCGATIEDCRQWNCERLEQDRYSTKTFDDLVFRFEEPDSRNRWDSPYFLVLSADEFVPCESVQEALFTGIAPKPSKANAIKPVLDSSHAFEVENSTNAIINQFFKAQSSATPGIRIPISGCKGTIRLPQPPVIIAELRRLRRQFLSLNKQCATSSLAATREAFIAYLEENLNRSK